MKKPITRARAKRAPASGTIARTNRESIPALTLTAALGLIVLIAGCSTPTLKDKDWHPMFERPSGTPLFITEWSKIKDIGPGSSLQALKELRWFKVPSGAILYTKKGNRYYEVAFKYTESEWTIQDVSYNPIHPRESELPAQNQHDVPAQRH